MKKLTFLISLYVFSSASWGNCVGNCVNGLGAYTFTKAGDKYSGEWKDGKITGQGTYTWADGRIYTGQWQDHTIAGQGTMTWPDGELYVGEWEDGTQNGQGTVTTPEGFKHFGIFKDGKRNGQGTTTWSDGRKYFGNFKDGNINGQGTMTWPDGRKYVGQFKDNVLNGQGTFTFSDNDTLSSGIGAQLEVTTNKYVRVTRILPGGPSDLHGGLKTSDVILGVGGTDEDIIDIFGWEVDDVIKLIRGDAGSKVKLKVRQKMFGGPASLISIVRGKIPWESRLDYIGQFRDGKLAGDGTLTFLDGSSFVGKFKNNEPVQGTEFLADKRQLVFKSSGIELRSAKDQLLRAEILNAELDSIREESLKNSRLAEKQLLKERRENKRLIVVMQKQLIEHHYLSGIADGIAGKNTISALGKFYGDIKLALPSFDDYTSISEDLNTTLLRADAACFNTSRDKREYTACFNIKKSR